MTAMGDAQQLDSVAEVVGGLLEAQWLLTDDVALDTVIAVVRGLVDQQSLWVPGMFADDAAAAARLDSGSRRPALWVAPDPDRCRRLTPTLVEAWTASGLPGTHGWATPSLRLEVLGLDDQRRLAGRAVGGCTVVTHTELPAGRFAWTWPLRVALGDADMAGLAGGQYLDRLYTVEDATPGSIVQLAVLRPADIDRLEGLLATVAVVVDADGWDPGELLGRAARLGLAAVGVVPNAPAGLVDAIVEELSHDQPLDVALAVAAPGALLAASYEFLAFTSIRAWAAYVARRFPGADGDELLDIARHRPFDHEHAGGTATVDVARRLDAAELAAVTEIHLLRSAAAEPPTAEPPAAPSAPPSAAPAPPARPPSPVMPDIGSRPPSTTHPPAPLAPGAPTLPERPTGADRRLQCQVADAAGTVRTDGFVSGARSTVRVCIAAAHHAGAVVAAQPFVHPSPGQPVTLTVVARVRGSSARPTRRRLVLPAAADSGWTRPIPVEPPPEATTVEVEIVVLHRGRALQTAVLSGPVVPAGPISDGGVQLHVDADVPPADLTSRSPAATVVVSAAIGTEPQIVDLSRAARPLDAVQLGKVNAAVRRILRDALTAGVTDLAGSAPALTQLAVRGATLRNQLRGNRDSFHDDDPWIHVVAFGQLDLPFELIYTHPMPADDHAVPVCAPASAGATRCAADCPQRTSADVVCPYAFWATSKVVERRVHIDDRSGTVPPGQRQIAVRRGAVVGTTDKANQRDHSAADRIAAAVEGAVAAGTCTRVRTWDELAAAVAGAPRPVVVLVTHTVLPAAEDADLGASLEIGGALKAVHRIDQAFVNPTAAQPGPVVLTLGCDTGDLDAGYSDWVSLLHAARAEVVVSTLSPVPGKEVADLVERVFRTLPALLAGPGPHRFGALLTEVRRATIATGDVLALALTASGDGDVELVGD